MSKRHDSNSRQQIPFVMVPKPLLNKFHPSWRGILAYMALAYYANTKAGACEGFTAKALGEIVGISPNTFRRGVAELVDKGVVQVRSRSRKGPANGKVPMPNLYEIQHIDLVTDPI